MRAFLENRFAQIRDYFGRMEKKAKIRLGILSGVVIVLAIITVSMLSRTTYVTLHVAQNAQEAGRIYEALLEMGEQAEVEGNRIMVLEGKEQALRVTLANRGILEDDATDLSIINSAAGFNITDRQATKLFEADTERKIRAQVLRSDRIKSAIVTVNYGEYSPFVISSGVKDATAAVHIETTDGAMLSTPEAQAIAELVRGNVQGIKYENISITDSKLNHYKVGDGSMDLGMEMNSRIALTNLLQRQIKMQCEQLLMPIFGVRNLEISASVLLNFDRRVTEWVEFYPPIPGEMDGIARSSSELYELQRRGGAAEGIPGTDSNALGTVEYPYATLDDDEVYKKAVIERNYEINETRELIEHEQGKVERLSIGISIDKETAEAEGDFRAEVISLVSRGLGIHPDNIAVEYVPFMHRDTSLEEMEAAFREYEALMRRREMIRMVMMWAVILLLGMAFISLIKTIVKAIRGPEPEELALADGGIDYLADDDLESEYDDIELNAKSSGLEQIEKFIDKDAGAVAQLLRNWLTDE